MSRLLLDTHALLFWWTASRKLGAKAREAIADPEVGVYVSAASAWEIATKFRIGKMPDIGNPAFEYPRLMASSGFETLEITAAHALSAGALNGVHRDPFDRLIAAQGIMEGMTVVTRDPAIAGFGCKVLW